MKVPASLAALLISATQAAEPLYTGPFGPGGTWNLYQLVKDNVTWEEARTKAEATRSPAGDPSAKGHLVTFSSPAENQFVRLLNREDAWCGLTDDDRFGGQEAGNRRRGGWKWLGGEALTFSNWLPDQPDDWRDRGNGEDAGFFDGSGRWGDNGTGTAGQVDNRFYYAVEWETRASAPVPGATAYTRAWPDKPVTPADAPGKWAVRWATGYVKFPNHWIEFPRLLADAAPLLLAPADLAAARARPLMRTENSGSISASGLSFTDDGAEMDALKIPQDDPFFAAILGKIHVEAAGIYTFAISAKDAFALRIGGQKWKSASGIGYIDPLDPLTVTQPNIETTSTVMATMDLPAGDHTVEALWLAGDGRSHLEVMVAPGVQASRSSTTAWRTLGSSPAAEPVAILGVTDAGWTVECTKPGDKGLGLQDGLLKLELDATHLSLTGVKAIDFADDAEVATIFPNEQPGRANNHWALRATARLVVPRDGRYQIHLRAEGLGALRLKGASLNDVADPPRGLRRQADAVDFDSREEIVTTWELKEGEQEIEVFYVKNLGPARLTVAGNPVNTPHPALLRAGGAGIVPDAPGLPLTAPR